MRPRVKRALITLYCHRLLPAGVVAYLIPALRLREA